MADSGFYEGFCKSVTLGSKLLLALIVLWAVIAPERAGEVLKGMQNWSFQNLNGYYIYAIAFFIIVCIIIAIVPSFGKVKLGTVDGTPEFSNFSWFSMMFGAGIGVGMLGCSSSDLIRQLPVFLDVCRFKFELDFSQPK